MRTPVSSTEELYDDIAKAARTEGTLTFYSGGHGGRHRTERKLYDLLQKKSGVEVAWFTSGGVGFVPVALNEEYAGELKFDVMQTLDLAELCLPLKNRRRLMRYVPPEAAALRKGMSDPEGYFHPVCGSAQVPLYNPEKLPPSELPKSFKDLLQPRWKDRLVVYDPTYAFGSRCWFAWMYSKYGPEYIVALAKQNPKTPSNIREAIELIVKGEADIIVNAGAPRYAESKLKGEPTAYFVMEEGAHYLTAYVAINARTKKPNLSKLFVRFLLSPEAQRILVEETFDSARIDITAPDWYFPFAKYEQEGKLLSDSSSYWPDVQRRYRNIAEKTFSGALRKTGVLSFQKLLERKPGIPGDGY